MSVNLNSPFEFVFTVLLKFSPLTVNSIFATFPSSEVLTSFRLPELVFTLKYALIGSASFSTPVITSCKLASPYGTSTVLPTSGINFSELKVNASFTAEVEVNVNLFPDFLTVIPFVVLKVNSSSILLLSVSVTEYFPSLYFISLVSAFDAIADAKLGIVE